MVTLSTPVTVSMKMLLSGIAVFCVGLWVVANFTISGLREDVSALRVSVDHTSEAVRTTAEALRNFDKDGILRVAEVSTKLSDQIQGLRVDFTKFNGNVEQVSGRLNDLSQRMEKFQLQLASTYSPEADARRAADLVDYLRKSGLDKERVIIVPLSPPPIR